MEDLSLKIPEGYKKTDHYIIPKHWEDLIISDIVKFSGGAQPPRSEFINYPTDGYVRLIQIRDYKTDDYLTYIPINTAKKLCDETDVMIGRYGPPIFQILRGIKGAYNVALMKAIPNEEKLLKEYLFYYLQNQSLFELIDRLSRRTSGQTGVDIDALNNFPFPLPPIEEQKEIVEFIKVWENTISRLQDLIEQKIKQKKGLMQNLLTGNKRLPGFNQEWYEVNLGDVLKERKEIGFENLQLLSITSGKGVVKRSEIDVKDNSSEDKSKYKRILPNDIGYNTMRMWQGVSGVSLYEGIVSPAYTVLEPVDDIESNFMGYLFKLPKVVNLFRRYSQGLVDDTLNLKYENFKKIKVKIPADKQEQKEISDIFKCVDKEIEALKKLLEAYETQKKYLMQHLITGKIRVKV